jgi:hypothetical protein
MYATFPAQEVIICLLALLSFAYRTTWAVEIREDEQPVTIQLEEKNGANGNN